MSPDLLETLVAYLVFTLNGMGFASFLFSVIFQCWGFFFNRNQNQQGDVESSAGDIELGETSNPPPPRVHVLPAISETWLPDIPGAKPLTMYAASDECAICLEDFKEKEVCWVLVKCDHVFHKPCAEEWLKRSFWCPLCRTNA
ncbi:PREDICTED: RING-H2 finger protein ATL39 [Theobroma cacao]|uniref:RING-H2 finger protein ATL39 n=1 Tax=Theobroma cacao TaxID=3641 RepID=A0AB32WL31_THECC|nr:PREDICTED: RING-H2 finger protein ATL39 [Theobroma cacao]